MKAFSLISILSGSAALSGSAGLSVATITEIEALRMHHYVSPKLKKALAKLRTKAKKNLLKNGAKKLELNRTDTVSTGLSKNKRGSLPLEQSFNGRVQTLLEDLDKAVANSNLIHKEEDKLFLTAVAEKIEELRSNLEKEHVEFAECVKRLLCDEDKLNEKGRAVKLRDMVLAAIADRDEKRANDAGFRTLYSDANDKSYWENYHIDASLVDYKKPGQGQVSVLQQALEKFWIPALMKIRVTYDNGHQRSKEPGPLPLKLQQKILEKFIHGDEEDWTDGTVGTYVAWSGELTNTVARDTLTSFVFYSAGLVDSETQDFKNMNEFYKTELRAARQKMELEALTLGIDTKTMEELAQQVLNKDMDVPEDYMELRQDLKTVLLNGKTTINGDWAQEVVTRMRDLWLDDVGDVFFDRIVAVLKECGEFFENKEEEPLRIFSESQPWHKIIPTLEKYTQLMARNYWFDQQLKSFGDYGDFMSLTDLTRGELTRNHLYLG